MKKKRLKLKIDEYISHFIPAIGIMVVPMVDLYLIIKSIITKNNILFDKITKEIEFPVLLFIISSFIFIYKYKSLEFKNISKETELKNFKKAIEITEKKLKWVRIEFNMYNYKAISNSSLIGAGELVTIIYEKGDVLINSIDAPNNTLSNFSFGGNHKNIETFKRNLKIYA